MHYYCYHEMIYQKIVSMKMKANTSIYTLTFLCSSFVGQHSTSAVLDDLSAGWRGKWQAPKRQCHVGTFVNSIRKIRGNRIDRIGTEWPMYVLILTENDLIYLFLDDFFRPVRSESAGFGWASRSYLDFPYELRWHVSMDFFGETES